MFAEHEKPNVTKADLVVVSVQKTMRIAIIRKCLQQSKSG